MSKSRDNENRDNEIHSSGSPFQAWLDRVNAKYGGIGSVIVATILLTLLYLTLINILSEYL